MYAKEDAIPTFAILNYLSGSVVKYTTHNLNCSVYSSFEFKYLNWKELILIYY